jgi:nudix motif 8
VSIPVDFDEPTLAAIQARLSSLPVQRVKEAAPEAAVFLPLCMVGGVPSVLFTKRSETVGSHKGQVSFPGGRRDAEDADEVATALRELEEEIGIARSSVRVLGVSHQVMSINHIKVTTVVGCLGAIDPGALQVSAAEIDVVFAVSLSALVDPQQRAVQVFGTRQAPVFNGGPFPIWGLTAYFMHEFLRDGLGLTLLPPAG